MTDETSGSKKNRILKYIQKNKVFPRIFIKYIINLFILSLICIFMLIIFIKYIPFLESIIFPSVHRIHHIENQTSVLHNKIENIENKLNNINYENSKIEKLTIKINQNNAKLKKIEDQIVDLNHKMNQFKINNSSETNKTIHKIWREILKKKDNGEAFSDELISLIPHVGTFKELIDAIHSLRSFASQKSLTLNQLKSLLEEIKNALIEEIEDDEKTATWLEKIIKSIKNLIIILKFDEKESKFNDKENNKILSRDADETLKNIDDALSNISENNLEICIKLIQAISISNEKITFWLEKASFKLDLDKAFIKMQKLIENIIVV